jgi:acyl-CoA thioesterase
VRRLAAADPFVRSLGITCIDAAAGTATVTMTLAAQHLNFNGTCHGGVTFALADTAFGLASNSHGRVAAGIDAHITYQQAATEGDTLTARAVEISRSKKLAVYRVDVTRGDGTPVSSFTGTVYVTQRPTP